MGMRACLFDNVVYRFSRPVLSKTDIKLTEKMATRSFLFFNFWLMLPNVGKKLSHAGKYNEERLVNQPKGMSSSTGV